MQRMYSILQFIIEVPVTFVCCLASLVIGSTLIGGFLVVEAIKNFFAKLLTR